MAQETRYRVEILVLTHLRHDAEAREYQLLDDYSGAIDFLTVEPESEDSTEALEEAAACIDPNTGEVVLPGQATEDEATEGELSEGELGDEALADVVLDPIAGEPLEIDPLTGEPIEVERPREFQVEEMSELMRENWRRMRLSAPFRPEQYLSWEQAADEPFPVFRIHDQEVVFAADPWAEERRAQALAALEAELAAAENPGTEPEEAVEEQLLICGQEPPAEEEALPDPIPHYRLDGTVTLRRSRFLHLDVRMDLREPLFEQPDPLDSDDTDSLFSDEQAPLPENYDSLVSGLPELEPEPPQPTSFLIHRLDQSRQVRTGRLEYFDHPVIGVLAYITRIEVPEEETASP